MKNIHTYEQAKDYLTNKCYIENHSVLIIILCKFDDTILEEMIANPFNFGTTRDFELKFAALNALNTKHSNATMPIYNV